ncbi:GNAT family N-acetyltransferase [Staphylococcus epidermidis]|uniref:GNAT family N-acetyltransferase n=1 Tax=Staphylococcus epidermidis TaxID=1282 RepID=UPI00026C1B28|nr:GNAT family N-acetyltransferase [Staphylococcus epidermidis]EJE04516.1 hypothetical protein HMPREF9983_11548 [Staphylococcus epidermidis NIHLM023]MBF2232599.1 hypothetical protein [Staphylococcus epidermidis]MCG1085153.1 hypothetical protein [Staphylococcus epidermidis]MCG2464390.1 hypothetical protein [Staphylococcus epidermidis]
MTTITEQGYQQFKMLSNNVMFRNHVKDSQDEITKILMSLLMCAPTKEHKTMLSRVLLLRDKYYLYISGGSLHLFTRDFKSAISFNVKQPNPKHIDYFTDDWIVEIDNLNSLKKGYGNQLMNEVLQITSVMKVDICLWTETISNTRYFEKYGFESIGKRGKAKENLMIKRKEA